VVGFFEPSLYFFSADFLMSFFSFLFVASIGLLALASLLVSGGLLQLLSLVVGWQ